MKFTEYREYEYVPLTIGLWRPHKVEEGFVEDYIRRVSIETDDIIIF